ncbi:MULTISPECIES: FecR family protein [Sphingobacterium]|uniref:FecR family protein n=1 Tax=Sphingobacterium TaxID=28453 RepID=UPI000DFCA6F5|nr:MULTISPECIES: FecR domain-containing protein [Sphingobacterium]QQT43508.1 FecR domain-containing protein [Sphingobacterium multivorum]SUI98005.1 fec operon regulator FecR [Sphingobacterium multivorum]HAE69968.1 hypothetical protein [Sphingobacterium sp.]
MEKNNTQSQAKALLRKYLHGDCTPEEEMKVLNWYQSLDKLSNIDVSDVDFQIQAKKIKRDTIESLSRKRNTPLQLLFQRHRYFLRIAGIFAVFIILGIITFNYYRSSHISQTHVASAVHPEARDILLPVDSLPSLRLPDGRITYLGGNLLLNEKSIDVSLIKEENGTILYKVQQNSNEKYLSSLTRETIIFSSPKGYKSKLLLADGSTVFLNSGASLEYPIVFKKESRNVKLIGEAYFEIAHAMDRPFYVETQQAKIKVLGTKFNVRAYSDEVTTTTSLIQGTIRLITPKSNVILKPGDQYSTNENGFSMLNKGVDLSDVTSWKDGYFSFNDAKITDILEQLGRWYNIEEINIVKNSEEKITGTFQQSNSLRDVLDRLEEVSDIKFEIKGRRLMVL